MSDYTGTTVRISEAVRWAQESLRFGSALAQRLIERLPQASGALLLAPAPGPIRLPLDDHSRGYPSKDVDRVAKRLFRHLAGSGLRTLVVEDDLARPGDPRLEGAAFFGERVLRWVEIGGDASDPVALLRRGASGYPLNAFVCRESPADLGLVPGASIASDEASRVATGARVVVVSVFDAEAFLVVSLD